jgi:hypothetical protein
MSSLTWFDTRPDTWNISYEHRALRLVPVDEIDPLNMPTPYKDAIRLAVAQT